MNLEPASYADYICLVIHAYRCLIMLADVDVIMDAGMSDRDDLRFGLINNNLAYSLKINL